MLKATMTSYLTNSVSAKPGKKNLIIHQIAEPSESLDRGGQRKEHDIQKVLDIFDYLWVPVRKEGIKFIIRAGENPDQSYYP